MKKNKLLTVSLSLMTIFALASCDTTSSIASSANDSTEVSSSEEVSSDTSSVTTSTGPVAETKYQVVIKNTTGITITSDVSSAKKGTTVTLTAALIDGYTLNGINLDAAGITVALTKVNETTYTFVMPDVDVIVSAELTVSGDVTIVGDIAIKLTDDGTGLYSATHVMVEDDVDLAFAVTANGVTSTISIVDMDPNKSFADIGLYQGEKDASFTLSGNAYYNFYYDSNATLTTYVTRDEIITAPTTVKQFENLFSGSIKSTSTVNPAGVNHVSYTNSYSHTDYEWDLYENGSFAKATDTSIEYDSYVYKQITGDKYSVVDTYTEGKQDDNGDAYDSTRADDTTALAANYKVVDNIDTGYSKYEMTAEDALIDATAYSHDMHSLDFDMHYGYRTGFTVGDNDLVYYNTDVTSVDATDGGFTTNVDTIKEYFDSTTYTAFQYSIEISFDKAGAPLSGKTMVKSYTSASYDFTNHALLPGGEGSAQLVKKTTFSYGYGEAKTADIDFDTTPYFVSSISNIRIADDLDKTSDTQVNQGNNVSDQITFDVAPTTALDVWQYGIDSSSATSVIGPRTPEMTLSFVAKALGTSTLTLNNHSTKEVSATVDIEVVNVVKARGFYITPTDYDDTGINSADSMSIYAGYSRTVLLNGSPANAPFANITIDYTSDLIDVTLDKDTHELTIDATNATNTEATDVVLTINTPDYEEGLPVDTITITVEPKGTYSSVEGKYSNTWTNSYTGVTYEETLNFSSVDSLTRDGYKQLDVVTYHPTTLEKTELSFDYKYDGANNSLKIFSNSDDYDFYYFAYASFDINSGELLMCIYSVSTDWYDATETDYVGYPLYDNEGNIASYATIPFSRVD